MEKNSICLIRGDKVVGLLELLQPETPEDLRDELARAARAGRSIELFGNNSKQSMAGPVSDSVVRITTARLNSVVQYEPRDLTISVGAGMPYAELRRLLAENGQMIPLDGPYAADATVGGMVAANISDSKRRGYGTARDWVIGMRFATLDGNLVQSGGMVVKNVAGLDMGKLMIGSFGTLAAITTVNFKLAPIPAAATTLLFSFQEHSAVFQAAGAALRGVLNPVAVDVMNAALTRRLGLGTGYTLVLSYAGNEAVIERATRESASQRNRRALREQEESEFWRTVRDLTPAHLAGKKDGAVGRVGATLTGCAAALASINGPGLAHAGSGIVRGWHDTSEAAAKWVAEGSSRGWKGVVEFSAGARRKPESLWPAPGGDFEIMRRVKQMFDPNGLLNSGRLYGLI